MLAPSILFDLSGRTARVTGGATGIGRACAEAMLAAGARLLSGAIAPGDGGTGASAPSSMFGGGE